METPQGAVRCATWWSEAETLGGGSCGALLMLLLQRGRQETNTAGLLLTIAKTCMISFVDKSHVSPQAEQRLDRRPHLSVKASQRTGHGALVHCVPEERRRVLRSRETRLPVSSSDCGVDKITDISTLNRTLLKILLHPCVKKKLQA